MTKRDADLREGDLQCPALLHHPGGALCCRYVYGHAGKHRTVYEYGNEWESTSNDAIAIKALRPLAERIRRLEEENAKLKEHVRLVLNLHDDGYTLRPSEVDELREALRGRKAS